MMRPERDETSREHVLPHPRPPLDPKAVPFVGNVSVDDNLVEAAQVAAWNAVGGAERALTIGVDQGVVTLGGDLDNEEQRRAVEAAIAHIDGVQSVVNHIAIGSGGSRHAAEAEGAALAVEDVEAEPLYCLTRFCSLTEASLSAAIRDAVATLDRRYEAYSLSPPDSLVVIYSNQHPDTVTVEIGMPVAVPLATGGQFHFGLVPSGNNLSTMVGAGAEALVSGHADLLRRARAAGYRPSEIYWQRFPTQAFRPWTGHPEALVHVPIIAGPHDEARP